MFSDRFGNQHYIVDWLCRQSGSWVDPAPVCRDLRAKRRLCVDDMSAQAHGKGEPCIGLTSSGEEPAIACFPMGGIPGRRLGNED
jgi:hypothetical protein